MPTEWPLNSSNPALSGLACMARALGRRRGPGSPVAAVLLRLLLSPLLLLDWPTVLPWKLESCVPCPSNPCPCPGSSRTDPLKHRSTTLPPAQSRWALCGVLPGLSCLRSEPALLPVLAGSPLPDLP